MKEIEERYNLQRIVASDINEHIQTLYHYGKQCNHITEMGVRWVSSTWAFLYSNPEKLISYDIVKDNNVNEVEYLAKRNNLNFNFIEADVLKVNIEETDLLFIDTLHTYNQLFAELQKHSGFVRKYIILHDTITFGLLDEINYGKKSDLIENTEKTKQGLVNALNDFLSTPIGNYWVIEKVYNNNNGLTILKRK